MFRRGLILLVLMLTLLAPTERLLAQPPQPSPNADPAFVPIPYSTPANLHDRNDAILWGHPDIEPPQAPPGWFVGMQVDIVGPAIMQHIFGQLTRDGNIVDINLPSAPVHWVGSPRIELGYRFHNGLGELKLAYRLLASQGNSSFPEFDPAGNAILRSRLDAQIAVIDYTSREFSLGPWGDMKAHVGVCVPSIFFDSQAVGPQRKARFSSYYVGTGPHLGFDYWCRTPIAGLELYARPGMNLTVGWLQQRFEESQTGTHGYSDLKVVREVPMAQIQTGLSYAPPAFKHQLRLLAGYTLERWWYLAQTDVSRGELTVQGVFLRAEWRY